MSDEQLSIAGDESPVTTHPSTRSTGSRQASSGQANHELSTRKRCGRCKRIKLIDEFGRNRARPDGLNDRCKVCHREATREFRARHRKRLAALRREKYARNAYAMRMKKLKYRHENPEMMRLIAKRYRLKNARKLKARRRKYYAENPHKVRAHILVRQALTYGDLKREECEICKFLGLPSDRRKTVAHHEDYDRPLDVRWLCHAHHRQLHAQHFSLRQAMDTAGNCQMPIASLQANCQPSGKCQPLGP